MSEASERDWEMAREAIAAVFMPRVTAVDKIAQLFAAAREAARAEHATEIANLIADNRNLLTNLHTAEEAVLAAEAGRAEERRRYAALKRWRLHTDGINYVGPHPQYRCVTSEEFDALLDAAIRAPDREPRT